MRPPNRGSRGALVTVARALVAVAGVLVAVAGCNHRLPQMLKKGEYERVVRRAEAAHFRPRKRSARAYATALHELGQTDKAMATLLLDFRRGGQLPSLIALADLERAYGWRGVAAHHYARIFDLDRDLLRGRMVVCDLFRERARAYIDAGEGIAADLDVRRIAYLCPASGNRSSNAHSNAHSDAQLAQAAEQAAQKIVDRQVANSRCVTGDCRPTRALDRASALQQRIESARASGDRSLYALSVELGLQLPPKDLQRLLLADGRGELAVEILSDHIVAGWVGNLTWTDLAPTVMSAGKAESAYLQLRLSAVVSDLPLPVAGPSRTRQLARWADAAFQLKGIQVWRLSAWQGDQTMAALDLDSALRPSASEQDTDSPSSDTSPAKHTEVATTGTSEVDVTLDVPAHWSARVELTADNLSAVLACARLRQAQGKDRLALELLRYNLTRAVAARLRGAQEHVVREATRALAWGRPWHALALLDVGSSAALGEVRAAAAASILLLRGVCGGSCAVDEDSEVAAWVMGEAWVQGQHASLHGLALGHQQAPQRATDCPTIAEVFARDAVGPLARGVAAARSDSATPGRGRVMLGALAALRPWCAARFMLPAMTQAEQTLSAGVLSEYLSQAPQMRASAELLVHAELAMVAGEGDRAQQLAIAAAAESPEPRAVWRRVGMTAQATGLGELQRIAWREVLLHSPSLHDEHARRELLIAGLERMAVSWSAGQEVGATAYPHQVEQHVLATPEPQRWAELEWVAAALLKRGFADRVEAERLVSVVFAQPKLAAVHRRLAAKLAAKTPDAAGSAFDGDGLADDARGKRLAQLPAITAALGAPAQFSALRLALAEHARDWEVRRRAAVGLAFYGRAGDRARAVVQLRAMVAPADLAHFEEFLAEQPAALEPGGDLATPRPVTLVASTDALVRLLLRLDLEPQVMAP